MTHEEGQYRYRDNEHGKGRFLSRFQRILDLHYTARYPAPDAVVDEAWNILALGRTEREVLLAVDWLREGFDRQKPVRTLREAREHAHTVLAKEAMPTRNETRGGTDSLLADNPTASRQSRAYLACTRWCAREIAELGRQGKDIGHPERQAIHEYHARQFAAIDANDPEAVGRWIEWAEAERQVALARKVQAMQRESIGPEHPCLGCVNRGGVYVATDPSTRRARPASQCTASGIYTPLFIDSPRPRWCPGKVTR